MISEPVARWNDHLTQVYVIIMSNSQSMTGFYSRISVVFVSKCQQEFKLAATLIVFNFSCSESRSFQEKVTNIWQVSEDSEPKLFFGGSFVCCELLLFVELQGMERIKYL